MEQITTIGLDITRFPFVLRRATAADDLDLVVKGERIVARPG